MVFVYTKCSSLEEAKILSKTILQKKLGYCVDYFQINSVLLNEDKIVEKLEFMIIITTFEQKIEEINDFISQNVAFATPFVAGVDIRRVNKKYKENMTKNMGYLF